METTMRRYTSPATPPRLLSLPVRMASPVTAPPVVCLRCAGAGGHAPHRLVSFEWGRVTAPNSRR